MKVILNQMFSDRFWETLETSIWIVFIVGSGMALVLFLSSLFSCYTTFHYLRT